MLKNGLILFQTDLGMSILRVNFENAYCINLKKEINSLTGTKTTLVITPEKIILNDTSLDNNRKKS